MEEGDIVICEMAEDCNKKRCPHNKPHPYDEDECDDHYCEKHMKEFDCDEVD